MNSTEKGQPSDIPKDNPPSTSQAPNPDGNANVSMATDESKGAIPKTRLPKPAAKKTNNNPEELAGEVLKRNGYAASATGNYVNNAFRESEPETGASSLLRPSSDFERTPLNIPVEDGFLNALYVPLGRPGSSFAELHPETDDDVKDSDSSSDDELLSVSDDGCIYTYKGDHVADLPSSFFNLEIPVLDDVAGDGAREENSSPEMDFLEMDFDPGPSGDADSDSISNAEIDNAASLPLDSKPEVAEEPKPCCSKDLNREPLPETGGGYQVKYLNFTKPPPEPVVNRPTVTKAEVPMPWSCSLSERTRTAKHLRTVKRHHSSKGELSSPNENGDVTNLASFHAVAGKFLAEDKNSVDKIMVWTDQEACMKQITQVGQSACGATAVVNVLIALRFPVPTLERLQECVNTRLRANSSPLTEYLLSRSRAGCSHRDVIFGLYRLSDKRIYARFFALHPERVVNLQMWLGYWIKNGAVPVATLNLQKCEGSVPDSWHHQMIFGVGPKGIYLTNPLECVDPSQLWPQLSSESVLLVKTEDVISRWNPKVDLLELQRINDVRWKELNVVGQVAKVVRENRRETRTNYVFTSHIKIPAEYKAGITLAVDINSPAFTLLRQCPELPLLQPDDIASAL